MMYVCVHACMVCVCFTNGSSCGSISKHALKRKKKKKERNRDSLEKWLILRLGQKIYEMNLEHLVVSKSKKDELNTHTQERNYVKKPTDRALMCKAGQLK